MTAVVPCFYFHSLSLGCKVIRNCSGSHQGTKTQRIDMSFTPLSEKEERIAKKAVD